jgi:anti-repressor protein
MNELQVFNYEGNNVRVVMVDNEVWFVAKDVASVLGYVSTNMPQVFQMVPSEWKGSNPIATPGGTQEMLCLSEQGLYFFLGRSDKPAALPYQKFIAGEVMPSIRKHGVYLTLETAQQIISDPDTIINLAQQIKAEREQNKVLQFKIEADKPKVLFADSVCASDTSILIGEMAKILRQNDVPNMGQNRFFEWLRQTGYLIRRKGSDYNMPTQRSVEAGLFEIREKAIPNPDGSTRVTKTTVVTTKGQIYFVNLFLADEDPTSPKPAA